MASRTASFRSRRRRRRQSVRNQLLCAAESAADDDALGDSPGDAGLVSPGCEPCAVESGMMN
jgi:hypothetical protein